MLSNAALSEFERRGGARPRAGRHRLALGSPGRRSCRPSSPARADHRPAPSASRLQCAEALAQARRIAAIVQSSRRCRGLSLLPAPSCCGALSVCLRFIGLPPGGNGVNRFCVAPGLPCADLPCADLPCAGRMFPRMEHRFWHRKHSSRARQIIRGFVKLIS